MSTGERRAELDGVRGVAILLVLVGHAFAPLSPLAAAGVALFFSLSGYLITGLLLAEHRSHGRLRLGRFYSRRLTRLAPPLFIMLLVMGAILGKWAQIMAPMAWATNYAGHLGFDVEPFGHTWSLAVEEQFYLVWPVALVLLLRLRTPALALFRIAMLMACWRLFVFALGHYDYSYSALETAAVPILGGCAVAISGARLPRRLAAIALASIVVVAGAGVIGGIPTWWLVVPILVSPLTAGLVGSARGAQWLAWRPLTLCGLASYSLYLWHKPVSWLIDGTLTPAGVALGSVVGMAAYIALERPLMRWREARRPSAEPAIPTLGHRRGKSPLNRLRDGSEPCAS